MDFAGTKAYRDAIAIIKPYLTTLESTFKAAVAAQGGAGSQRMDSYFAGYINYEAEIEGGAGSATIPEFSLVVLTPMQVNQGMGFSSAYWGPSDTSLTTVPPYVMNDADQDLYRTQQILYGHSGWIHMGTGSSKYGRNSLSDVLTEFYLMQELQNSYLKAIVSLVEYYDGSSWLTLTQALASSYDFYNAKVRVTYNTGLVVVGDTRSIRKKYEFPGTETIVRGAQLGWYFQSGNKTVFTDM